MATTTIYFGAALVVLGLLAYFLTGQTSFTAMIPSFFGIALCVVGQVARNEKLRKHAMHAAAFLALLGLGGAGARAIPALLSGEALRGATIAQLVMVVLMLVFLVLCIRSFIEARRSAA